MKPRRIRARLRGMLRSPDEATVRHAVELAATLLGTPRLDSTLVWLTVRGGPLGTTTWSMCRRDAAMLLGVQTLLPGVLMDDYWRWGARVLFGPMPKKIENGGRPFSIDPKRHPAIANLMWSLPPASPLRQWLACWYESGLVGVFGRQFPRPKAINFVLDLFFGGQPTPVTPTTRSLF